MFKRLLIANRGEIAVRIARTARRLGIETIAVYSEADANALHVRSADRALRIGPAPAAESYLNIAAVLEAARAGKADAIHPGYGFLAENAEFAEAVAAAGLIFVGPSADAIRAMGLKDRAKAVMATAGVPVVPGFSCDGISPRDVARKAAEIGFPVLIKPVAGGGGKGMHRVGGAGDLSAALEAASREAKASFGDDRLLIEKYVSRPRHIEVQVFGDTHGNVIHLFERDCSLQRRHQKIIEEAPAPAIPGAVRGAITSAAVKAAEAVSYAGAGTVEFIADASAGLRADKFWFMEMNTRLQVEHPVTEEVTGLDLVEWQLRVAAGAPLPMAQKDIHLNGHAIEARIYAEDPDHGFVPSIGRLEHLKLPEDVRVDSGVSEGDGVTMYYDPMIAKVIAHAPTRALAIEALSSSLARTEIAGVRTNNRFLIEMLSQPAFRAGDIDTGLIDRCHARTTESVSVPADVLAAAAAYVVRASATGSGRAHDPWSRPDGFRIGPRTPPVIEFLIDGKREGTTAGVDAPDLPVVGLSNGTVCVFRDGAAFELKPYDPLARAEAEGEAADRIVSPMPGKVTRVLVKDGERVAKGQALAILEAMKMEQTLSAPADREIESVLVVPGDQVSEGAVIIQFKGAAA